MKVPIASSNVTKCAVSLDGAHHKTLHVKLTNQQSGSNTRIAALQVDNENNVVTSKILQGTGENASFRFFSDGELWLTTLVESSEGPMSANKAGSVSFGMSEAELSLDVEDEGDGGSRDTMTDAKVKIPDEV